MTQYEAFDSDVEVNGRTILNVAEEALAQFSERYRDRAFDALANQGITDPDPNNWYPQQAWLNAFEAIGDDLEPHVLDRLGEQIPAVANWPEDVQSVEEGLRSIDDAYQRNHRGSEIGSYRFEKTGEQEGDVVCNNPYPCEFDRGLVRAVAQRYAPVDSFVFLEEHGDTCRRNGDDRCVYTVYW
ncbi:hypothetical protein GJ632_11495 [Halogeometricum sp. CBA1124]|jgi:hypothetical protein|nr:hypothetical protein [Halogeometricum sp. CBA1124]